MAIYRHSVITSPFCVIKLYYLGNYHGMAVNYRGILTLEKGRVKNTMVIYHCIFYTIGYKEYYLAFCST
jgi:hypothetical protein